MLGPLNCSASFRNVSRHLLGVYCIRGRPWTFLTVEGLFCQMWGVITLGVSL